MNPVALLQTSPDAALVTLCAGILLIYYECNRPGSILPGCAGALLTLLAVNGLVQMPLRPAALALITLGFALILYEAALPARNLVVVLGTAALISGLAQLLQPFAAARVHLLTALTTGACLALSTFWLARIALRARRSKRSAEGTASRIATLHRVD